MIKNSLTLEEAFKIENFTKHMRTIPLSGVVSTNMASTDECVIASYLKAVLKPEYSNIHVERDLVDLSILDTFKQDHVTYTYKNIKRKKTLPYFMHRISFDTSTVMYFTKIHDNEPNLLKDNLLIFYHLKRNKTLKNAFS